MSRKKQKKKAKKMSIKLVIFFILFEIIFTGVTAPFIVYHGPFDNVKNNLVGAAMTTLSHKWIAKLFLSEKEINKILSEQSVVAMEQREVDEEQSVVKVQKKDDPKIERYNVEGRNFDGYVLIVNDPTRIKVGYSKKLEKKGQANNEISEGQPTSEIANDNNAIAAINGGGFIDDSGTGTGAKPSGIIMSDGKLVYNDVRSINQKIDVVAMTESGNLLVGLHTIKQMQKLGVKEAVCFGPALIVDGEKAIKKGNGNWGIAPRTAIGQRKDGAIILLVIDGRSIKSIGASLREVQDVLYDYGAYNASNLDGGSSATMYYDGEVINNPSDPLGERTVPSIIYVESR